MQLIAIGATMNRDDAPKTFIGPITTTQRAGATPSYFHVLQSTSGMIKLDYPSRTHAKEARKQLLKSVGTFSVNSAKLLEGIQQALHEAGTQSSPKEPPINTRMTPIE